MRPKISLITLGVADLEASIRFYRDGLGWPMRPREPGSDIAFFPLDGVWLSLHPRAALAGDATVDDDGAPGAFPGFTLAHNVTDPAAVDAALEAAVAAGAALVKPGQRVHWGGYSGYFRDPDGFLWEVAHNPFTDLT